MISIAISGKAKSGKNTLSEIIKNEFNMRAAERAFADPLKNMAIQIFQGNHHYKFLYGASEERETLILNNEGTAPLPSNKSYRSFLKDIGKVVRSYNENAFVELFLKEYHKIKNTNNYDLFICTDLRFLNEFNYLKNNNFYMIRIKRENVSTVNHQSETEQDKIQDNSFDWVIENNSTKEDLIQLVKPMIVDIKLKE